MLYMIAPLIIATLLMTRVGADDNVTALLPPPLVMQPSGLWDGSDGPWASFNISVGPGQTLRAFPSLSLANILVPMQAGICDGNFSTSSACASRGVYNPAMSPNWKLAGQVNVLSALSLSSLVGGESRDESLPYGSDTIEVSSNDSEKHQLPGQTVAGLTSSTFFMGMFGMSNKAFSLGEEKTTTFLSTFKYPNGTNMFNSFSYTAGAWAYGNRKLDQFFRRGSPSLILGGYNTRIIDEASTLEVDLRSTNTVSDPHQLTVNVSSITIKPDFDLETNVENYDPTELPIYLESGMAVNIDSTTPQIWLPKSACATFENKLHLQWDERTQLYLINSTNHERLLQQNNTIIFGFTSARSNGAVKNISIPYAAFDLTVSYPITNTTMTYFPLKRASRADQYILGRAFLQWAHVSVDYGSGYFNLSQRRFGAQAEMPNVVPIVPKPRSQAPKKPPAGLQIGAYAGIAIGAAIFLAILVLLFIARRKRWWPFKKSDGQLDEQRGYVKAESHDDAVPMVEAMEKERAELETKEPLLEAAGVGGAEHRPAGLDIVHEMDGGGWREGRVANGS